MRGSTNTEVIFELFPGNGFPSFHWRSQWHTILIPVMTDQSDKHFEAHDEPRIENPTWARKFAVAFRGLWVAITEENSFVVHFLVTGAVLIAGLVLGLQKWEWCVVVLCVMAGLSTELLNTAIERIAKVITREYHPEVRNALDIASSAVLIISIGAAVLGLVVLGGALWRGFSP